MARVEGAAGRKQKKSHHFVFPCRQTHSDATKRGYVMVCAYCDFTQNPSSALCEIPRFQRDISGGWYVEPATGGLLVTRPGNIVHRASPLMTTQKLYALKNFDEPLATEILLNLTDPDMACMETTLRSDFLKQAFDWSQTGQGSLYWARIYCSLREMDRQRRPWPTKETI
jgi:hypothetical protein